MRALSTPSRFEREPADTLRALRRVHPCNLYEFSIYGGMSPDYRYMEPLLHSTLKNDSTPESFKLPIEVSGVGDRAGAVR